MEEEYFLEEYSPHIKNKKTVSYYKDSIIHTVLYLIHDATKSILGNMAYLTNDSIIEALISKAVEGIEIELIISNTDNNYKLFNKYNDLLEAGIKIYQHGVDDWREGIMHKKSVVIDNDILLSGSFNWTNQAERNLEELFVIEDKEIIAQVTTDFLTLKKMSNQLKFNKINLGGLTKCSKEKVMEIQNWWKSLDDTWKKIFISRFSINDNPSDNELISLTNSEYVVVKFNNEINDITPLKMFTNVKHLVIYNCPKIHDLTPISRLTGIKILDLAVTSVSDLSPLSDLYNLEELNISNTKVTDLDSIIHIKLKRIIIYNLEIHGFFKPTPKFFKHNKDCKINFS